MVDDKFIAMSYVAYLPFMEIKRADYENKLCSFQGGLRMSQIAEMKL